MAALTKTYSPYCQQLLISTSSAPNTYITEISFYKALPCAFLTPAYSHYYVSREVNP